jgi:hypothetical protein
MCRKLKLISFSSSLLLSKTVFNENSSTTDATDKKFSIFMLGLIEQLLLSEANLYRVTTSTQARKQNNFYHFPESQSCSSRAQFSGGKFLIDFYYKLVTDFLLYFKNLCVNKTKNKNVTSLLPFKSFCCHGGLSR